MKKIILAFIAIVFVTALFAQKKSTPNLLKGASDHILLQLSYDRWSGITDSLKKKVSGLPRGANIYFMLDKPLKANNHYSIAFGLGLGTSSMYFKAENIGITANTSTLQFTSIDSIQHFKKYKLATTYLEAPVELRFVDKPLQNNKSLKAAVGLKLGALLNVHTKGKTLLTSTGSVINAYTEKENDKHFFNGSRVTATARVGYGNFSLFGNYSITGLLKDGMGQTIHPIQIGFCISGL